MADTCRIKIGGEHDNQQSNQCVAGGCGRRGTAVPPGATPEQGEPESLEAALATWVPLLLPERDPAETLRLLGPVVRDPELASKVEKALPPASGPSAADLEMELMDFFSQGPGARESTPRMEPPPAPLAHVVGVILGSPEFQRR